MRRLFLATIVLALVAISVSAQPTIRETFQSITDNWFAIVGKVMNYVKYLLKKPTKDPCFSYNCPKYDVKQSGDNYELRCYIPYKWVATVEQGKTLTKEMAQAAYDRLKKYMGGYNKAGKDMGWALPLAYMIQMDRPIKGNNTYTNLLFLPFDYQKSTKPPQPNDPQVFFVDKERFCAYVTSFGGKFTEEMIKQHMETLIGSLKNDHITDYVDPRKECYIAEYTDQSVYRNEIWLLKKQRYQSTR